MNIVTDERCLGYELPGHPESPERVRKTLALLRSQKELRIRWHYPSLVDDEIIQRAHSDEHIDLIKRAPSRFRPDTPAYPNIYEHARRSVGGAIKAMHLARHGELVFSLMRPPGHHASRDEAMGFCYFNSMATAVMEGLAMGVRTMAVFDFDVHHGNGTQEILLNQPHVAFFSVQQHPCFPGTGKRNKGFNCFNYPVLPDAPRKEYCNVLQRAFDDLRRFDPDLIGVCAGFDAYAGDAIAREHLEIEDFYWLGQMIRNSGIPAFSILEGGYSKELPELIFAYLKGLSGK